MFISAGKYISTVNRNSVASPVLLNLSFKYVMLKMFLSKSCNPSHGEALFPHIKVREVLCGFCMFFPCLCGFPLGFLALSNSPKTVMVLCSSDALLFCFCLSFSLFSLLGLSVVWVWSEGGSCLKRPDWMRFNYTPSAHQLCLQVRPVLGSLLAHCCSVSTASGDLTNFIVQKTANK